jgi:hypothetical protein
LLFAQSHPTGSAIGSLERRMTRSEDARSSNVLESSQLSCLKAGRRLRMEVTETHKLFHRARSLYYFSESSIFSDTKPATQATGGKARRGLRRHEHSTCEARRRYTFARAARPLPLECGAFTRSGLLSALCGPATAPRRHPGADADLARQDETWELVDTLRMTILGGEADVLKGRWRDEKRPGQRARGCRVSGRMVLVSVLTTAEWPPMARHNRSRRRSARRALNQLPLLRAGPGDHGLVPSRSSGHFGYNSFLETGIGLAV